MAIKLITDEERFFRNCEELENGCWQWKLKPDPDGYGHFRTGNHFKGAEGTRFRWLAHRWAYGFYIGRLFSNLTIDHLCRNRACVNPYHLEQVTGRTNTQRGERATATHCKRGHAFSGENLMIQAAGKRRCKTCCVANIAEWNKNNPEKVAQYQARYRKKRKVENKIGLGDEVIVTALARQAQATNPLPVAVRDKSGSIRWHSIWSGNPRIVQPGCTGPFQWLDSRGGCRPYINYAKTQAAQWHWKPYICEPGEIYLNPDELAFRGAGSGRVILEPNIKGTASPNKNWGFQNWQILADWLRKIKIPLLQVGPLGVLRLNGVEFVTTHDFRQACGVLSGARAIVTAEGALHHAAAVFGVHAFVIRGGFIGPTITGYPGQTDFFVRTDEHPHGCGFRSNCLHCRAAMDSIKPRAVGRSVEEFLITDSRDTEKTPPAVVPILK